MPDEIEDSTLDEELEKLPNRARQHLRETEKKLKQRDSEVEEGRKAKRELAAIKAGLDLDSGSGQLFADAYKGEWEVGAVKEAMAKYGITSAPTSGQPDAGDEAANAQRQAERQAAIEGQQHLGETKFGDWKPEGASAQQQLIRDLQEAHSEVTATDYVGALEQSKAVMRRVLHDHGMVLADEVD